MGLFNSQKIKIKESFDTKYNLIITTDIQTGNMPINTKAKIRWDIKADLQPNNQLNLEIITLENELLEYNNPMVKDIANMSQVFAKIYSELNLQTDHYATLKKINNIDQLNQKWALIKNELEQVKSQDPMIERVIQLNDEQLANPQTLLQSIQHNEFFQIYLHQLYGSSYHVVSPRIQSKNLLNTLLLELDYRIDKIETRLTNCDTFQIQGFIKTSMSQIKDSYKQFSHLDLKKQIPQISEEGIYSLDKQTGKIIHAILEKKEIVDPLLLHASIKYELVAEQ